MQHFVAFANLCCSVFLGCMWLTCLHHSCETFACKAYVAASEAIAVHLHYSLYRASLKWTCSSLHLSPLLDFLLRNVKSGYQHLKCGFISNSCSCFANKVTPTHSFLSWTCTYLPNSWWSSDTQSIRSCQNPCPPPLGIVGLAVVCNKLCGEASWKILEKEEKGHAVRMNK